VVVFAICVALWCLTGALLTRQQRVTETIGRYGHWILPAAFILIGLYILYETLHR
jgi:cadmium resistance protein CadD (predicted permease)